jgi:hypothetical protein
MVALSANFGLKIMGKPDAKSAAVQQLNWE